MPENDPPRLSTGNAADATLELVPLARDLDHDPLSKEALARIEERLGAVLKAPLPSPTRAPVAPRKGRRPPRWMWLLAAAVLVASALAVARGRSGWFGLRSQPPTNTAPAVPSIAPTPHSASPDPSVPAGSFTIATSVAAPTMAPVIPQPSEADLLARARQGLGTSPATALAVADEHARRYPRGVLAQEREVIAIDALERLGRPDEARSRGERFERDYPSSMYRTRVEQLLGAPR